MRRLAFSVCCFLLVLVACSQPNLVDPGPLSTLDTSTTSELYFSEYVEGSSNNKALEIYNGTNGTAELSEYTIQVFFNGSADAGLTVGLEGQLLPGEVFVLAHASADPAILAVADETTEAGMFNGDDAVVLRRGGAVVDSIGQIGFDPGNEWGSGLTSTQDNSLRRNSVISSGDSDPSDAFDPSIGWTGVESDSFTCLGSHSSCTPGTNIPSPDPDAITAIYEIQGDSGSSPFDGDTVTIRGVVVGDFQEYGSLGGFFVQELEGDGLDETSDGIFVYHYSTAVKVGDVVEVKGDVDEYHGLTELTDVEFVEVLDETTPVPTVVSLPLDEGSSWERFEGMLVALESSSGRVTVTEVYHLGRGGLVLLADDRVVQYTQVNEPSVAGYEAHVEKLARRTILLDDGSTDIQNPDPIPYSSTGDELTANHSLRVGDTAPRVVGVVTESWSGWGGTDAYRIHPTKEVAFVPSNRRSATPPEVGGDIQIASFNVLNFFNGDASDDPFPTARGADSPFELERQLEKLVSAILPLDAEVLGLIEIENDAGADSALADIVSALNEAAGAGTYAYVDTGVIGTDEIKVALVYQPDEVVPTGDFRVLDSTIDPRFDDSKNRPALGQTFQLKGTGERFTVIVNHLKSKGSECPGDPDIGDGQGNCNVTRTEAAKALADWADVLATESGDPDVVIMGDLNSYAMEEPIQALRNEGFENLLELDEFTYVFAGESGTLDHALATPSFANQVTGAEVWNINAEEPSVLDYNTNFKSERQIDLFYSDSPFRASDHDPVIIGLDLERAKQGRGRR